MKKDKIKNIAIIILVVIIIILAIFLIMSEINQKDYTEISKLTQKIQESQKELSLYLGKMKSDTYGIYNDIQILSGVVTEDKKEEIKDTNDKVLTPIIDLSSRKEINNKVYYKVNTTNFNQILKMDLPLYDNQVTWYIEDGNLLKVDFQREPEWWSSNFNYLKVGNN